MSEAFGPFPDHDADRERCVQRYEAMESSRLSVFFDVEEILMVIDHYLERGEPKRANEVVQYAMQLHPSSSEILFYEALVMMALGRLRRAMELLERVEVVEPYNVDVQLNKAGIYSQQRDHRRAVAHYKRALELAGDGLDEIYLDLAFEYQSLEEYDRSIACLKSALELNPENEAVLYELAYCYDLAGATEACISFLRNFLDDHPYSSVGWYNLGNTLAGLERYRESNEALDLAIAIDERFSAAYFSKARNLLLMSRYEQAIACYEETIHVDGAQAITHSFIGECYEKMEQYQRALIHYDQAIALDPAWVDAWIGRGVVKNCEGKPQEALVSLQQALRLDPDNTDALYYCASALARAGSTNRALAMYDKLNQLDPANLDAWMEHAQLIMELEGAERALEKFREAAQVHGLNARYIYRLASYLLQAGRQQEALVELEQALVTDHSLHSELLEHWPNAARMPQVLHLIELYRR